MLAVRPLPTPPVVTKTTADAMLVPPQPIDNTDYPKTPSLTSSHTSIATTDPQITPPTTASTPNRAVSPPTLADRTKSTPIDGLVRNDSAESPISAPHRVPSPLAQPDSTPIPRPRPPRVNIPSTFIPKSARSPSQDGLSIISVTSYYKRQNGSGISDLTGARRSQSSAGLLDGHSTWLAAICHKPKILGTLLQFIEFAEFHALTCTTKAMREIMNDSHIQDVILTRFVPGFKWTASVSRNGPDDIHVDIRDLEALMLSQAIPLHIYPQHALDLIAGLPHTESTTRLQHFTNVHSKFVLLLRLRAPALSFLSDLDDPLWRFGAPELPNLREVTFPTPLSIQESTPAPPVAKHGHAPRSPTAKSRSARTGTGCLPIFGLLFRPKPSHAPEYPRPPPNHPSGGRLHGYPTFAGHIEPGRSTDIPVVSTVLRRSTRSKKLTPPPPEYTPRALKQHRRRSRAMSLAFPATGSVSSTWRGKTTLNSLKALSELDSELFTPPQPPHLRTSSLPLPASSRSTSGSERSSTALGALFGANFVPPTNPHDLALAASRSRAPVCRIFVPCDNFSPSTLLACEGQLFTAGLWVHLRPGDVICNIGYVPPVEPNQRNNQFAGNDDPSLLGWLIFTGQALLPYFPPLPPTLNAFQFPSPMYYTHLLPTFMNPRFFLSIPPAAPGAARRNPELTLVTLMSSLRSPATRSGVVRARKFAWVGKVDGYEIWSTWKAANSGNYYDDAASEMFGLTKSGAGQDGWNVEWVVEAEGTKEGRESLLAALDPHENAVMDTEWEIVRDKCTPGRLWMKLIVIPPPTESTDDFGLYR